MSRSKKLIIGAAIIVVAVITVLTAVYASGNSLGSVFGLGMPSTQALNEESSSNSGTENGGTDASSTVPDETAKAVTGTQDTIQDGQNGNDQQETDAVPGEIKRPKVKAIYLSGTSAGSTKVLDKYIDLINRTELNAVVIDVKEAGKVNYKSDVPEVADNGLYVKYFDPEKVLKKLHDNNIYVIGRIVCFRDNGFASKYPDLAVKRPDGSVWIEGKLGAWTNPYKEEVWKYNTDIAKEAISKGFDEIQFDYVRFPTAKKNEVSYGSETLKKSDAIYNFLKFAAQEIHDAGVPISADVFGIIAESKSDGEAIGQDLEKVGIDIDAISPMVYPSHYAKGQEVNGVTFKKPDLEPYDVVYQTLLKAKTRISSVTGYKATVRPYLQNFTAKWLKSGNYMTYGPEQVRQQIKAVYDAGYEEWILWSPSNLYAEEIFQKE